MLYETAFDLGYLEPENPRLLRSQRNYAYGVAVKADAVSQEMVEIKKMGLWVCFSEVFGY